MKTVDRRTASELVHFAPTPELEAMGFADLQLDGAVAAYNQLATNRVAYLADEVGMGKTYVALGAMALLRHFQPDARVLVIAPRENLQRKWVKELGNFVEANWRAADNRVRSLQGTPAREASVCQTLRDLVTEIAINPDRDFFLRMTSFSLWTKKAKHRHAAKQALLGLVPWMDASRLPTRDAHEFRVAYGQVLNAILPDIDLLVVDEGHNLKHGVSPQGSTRNVLLASMFGHADYLGEGLPRSGPRVKRLLLLSATPFEHDYADLWRQFDVFGLGNLALRGPDGERALGTEGLRDSDLSEAAKRGIVERFLVRRVSGLNIADTFHTKNMYRREWRQGGFRVHDEPMVLEDPRQRLVVALVQKKVSEVLGHERFNNHFQIGMLSSFESFLESTKVGVWEQDEGAENAAGGDGEEEEERSAFDGRQSERKHEKEGIDTQALSEIVRSYHRRFGGSLPHPKLDTSVEDLAGAFETGEKALVFVRRIATMAELKARLDERYNAHLQRRMRAELPGLEREVDVLFERFEGERRRWDVIRSGREEAGPAGDGDGRLALPPDTGGRDSFFAWFFRGEGPSDVLSGAAFQKNRLSSPKSAYATLFEDDLVAWLLDRPSNVMEALARHLGRPEAQVRPELRGRAWAVFRHLSGQKDGYPRLHVFEAYQAAAMEMIRHAGVGLAHEAEMVLQLRFDGHAPVAETPPPGFPEPEISLGATTLITELAKRPHLLDALLPRKKGVEFSTQFLDRERRRELLSAMCRLGAAYVDLYLLAIRHLGSFGLGQAREEERPAEVIAQAFAARLAEQQDRDGFHAYRELRETAKAFDVLVNVNFPEVREARLADLPRLYGTRLTAQAPVATPRSGALTRLVRQFRMPGYPLVLVTTDILQEGEDLHTFCRKVVHYGISWTPSAMEQRTGRVDRIGGLVQRRLDGQSQLAREDEFIQVHYPHLQDTVEVLQVRRVFERMNRFLRLLHRNLGTPPDKDSRIDAAREMLALHRDVEVIREPLESAFPVREGWLRGVTTPDAIRRLDEDALGRHLEHVWSNLVNRLGIQVAKTGRPWALTGELFLEGDHVQPFDMELRSQAVGDGTLLRCMSTVGALDLSASDVSERLRELQYELGMVKVCARPDAKRRTWTVSLEGDLPFDPETTQPMEVETLLLRTARAAQHVAGVLIEDREQPRPHRPRDREMERLREMARGVAKRSDLGLDLRIEDDSISARFPASGRRQTVHLDCRGNRYVFTSVVLDAAAVRDEGHSWEELAEIVWQKNARTDLVTFAFDEDDSLIGRIEHPIGSLDSAEFEAYLLTMLRECDRFEYSLSGQDQA